ncbi:receptor-like protein kinase FERONIA [Fagus crenata]
MEVVSHSISKLFRSDRKRAKQSSGLPEDICRRFSLAEIKIATNDFDEHLVIGKGGFGKVYKGCIDDRTINVAIKRKSFGSTGQGSEQFRNEVPLLCQLSHPNLVPLIGYCMDEPEMILVYEFMVNGTLSDHLFGTNHDPLPWKQRLQICVGVARGLHYLHAGVKHTIIHRDVKPSNILLDEKWEAKLTDFGLSKMGPPSLSNKALIRMESGVAGTLGYLDPEHLHSGELSDKSDVYSFGVLLLEVLSGRKVYDGEEQMDLISWTVKCIREGTINQIIDPYLMGKIAPECFKIYMDIATSCVRKQGTQRPTIGEVEVALEHALELQESKDMDPGIGRADQYMYPILEYTGCDSPSEEDESNSDSDGITSARFSLASCPCTPPNGR